MYQQELETALSAAAAASAYLLDEYARFQKIANAPATITTEADRQAQEIILQHIHRTFPTDALCGEEATATLQRALRTGPRLWIVDPIDGTRGFARKNGEFSVMIAFVHDGQLAVGVVEQPAAGRLTYAARGQGCWRRDGGSDAAHPCAVSPTAQLAQATLTQSHSKNPNVRSPLVQALNPARVVESYSAGIKLALVARGEADLYVNTYDAFSDWDIAAGHLLVEEAGGTVTGLRGQKLRYGLEGAAQRDGLLASNGKIHAETLARMP